ncbi:MAG TPA: FtsK/SpoIIIE domain-containing protein [Dermatophilaceae bacterium]|nr:FtsK/SpoIIIE domain-containing protein [Dermatophilaceae bacterium]
MPAARESGPVGWLAVRAASLLAARVVRVAVETAREAWWVIRCLPHLAVAVLVLLVALVWAGQWVTTAGIAAGAAGLLSWPSWDRASWLDVTDRARTRHHRRRWEVIAAAVGLLAYPRVHDVGMLARPGVPPRLLRGSTTRGGVATLRLRYAPGQTIDDLERAAPALAALLGGHSVRVAAESPTRATVTLTVRDQLRHVCATPLPAMRAVTGRHPLAAVEVGRVMTGDPWLLDARVHTLVAGATGAGKASVMWSLLLALAPAVRAGTVRLVGVDLKRGMELTHAADLFSALATTPEQAVAVLEREAALMDARAASMAGQVRAHTPTAADPHVLVVVDELAALTSYLTDRDLTRRADTALRVLLSQGRAPGWTVAAWVQDPRKDSVPMRNLFPQMIGLRLNDAWETEMVLGEGRAKVAPCHRISQNVPGTGYAIEETGHTVKVRAHYADDDLIHDVAARYATPHRLPDPDLTPPDDAISDQRRDDRGGLHLVDDPATVRVDRSPSPPAAPPMERARPPRKPRPPRGSRRPAALVDGGLESERS